MYLTIRQVVHSSTTQNLRREVTVRSRGVVLTALVLLSILSPLHSAIIEVPADQPTVQDAINAASSGDTIRLDFAFSPFTEGIISFPAAKPNLTLLGEGSTIMSTSVNFGIDIMADDIAIEDLTLDGAGTFGFITGNPAVGGNGLRLEDCTAQNCGGTGFAITGVDDVTLNNLTSTNNGGNGMSLTSVQDATITDYTSSGNTFGSFGAGIGIFSCDTYTPCEATNITITGVITIAESPQIYSQEDVCGGTCGPGSVSNITLNPSNITYTHFLGITDQQKFFYTSLTESLDAADAALDANPAIRPVAFVEDVALGNKYIGPRTIAAVDLSVQAALDFASDGDTVHFLSGTMVEGSQIVVDVDITFQGSGKTNTILRPGFDTGTGGDARGWFVVSDGVEANFNALTLNGLGNLIWQAIRHKGFGAVDSVLFTEIKYNESGPNYQGTAMAVFGSGNVDVRNSMFTEIGRIGVLYFGSGVTGSLFINNMYTGKGDGDFLDYALDISSGAQVTAQNNIISDNRGIASVDGSASAGILVSTFFGPGTTASISGNDISDNFYGIIAGFNGADQSTVTARNNNITGNRIGVASTNAQVDAILNWWGAADGPDEVGPGSGDSVTVNVSFCPWLESPFSGIPVSLDPVEIICPRDFTLDCGEAPNPSNTGFPTAVGPLNFEYRFDDSVTFDPAGPNFYTIYREWIVENTCGDMDTCEQIIFIQDSYPPQMTNCPADVYIDLSDNLECDTTVFLEAPTAVDNCEFFDFSGPFDEGFWTLSHTNGDGTNGTAEISPNDDTLTMVGSDDGTTLTFTDYCVTIPHDGRMAFEWTAVNELGGTPLPNDRPAFVIDGAEVELLGSAGALNSINLNEGQTFCYRVKSDQVGSETTFEITSQRFTPDAEVTQIAGPVLDDMPGSGTGDDLTPGVYEVVWEGEDFAGNTARCTTEIVIAGADNFTCKDINVSLDQNCGARVFPEMVLTDQYVCAEFFVVELFEHGVAIGDSIDLTHLGKTLDYTVTDPGSGNSCWGKILVEDKYPPQFVCENDSMSCIEFQFEVDTPEVIDFCQDVTVILIGENITNRDCDGQFVKFVNRQWIAMDESGNVSDTCNQSIWIERFPMAEVQGPVMDTSVYCGSGYDTTAAGYPAPEDIGVPTLDGMPLFPLPDFFCNVLVDHKDFLMGRSGCAVKILRQWKVTEWWCNEDSVRRFDQFITIIDTVGPEIEIGIDTLYAKAGQRSCDALVDLPVANVVDVCHDVDRVDMVYPGGFSGNQNGGVVRLPVGIDTVVYRSFDNCYNQTTDTLIVVVQDAVAPVAVCDQNTTVTLGLFGTATVEASAFDDGSFDECELDSFSVRRMNDVCGTGTDEWGSFVDFCCADVGTEVMVEFRVTDISGNQNTCMVRVQVQDKQAPRIVGLPNIRVDCRFDWDSTRLDVFGKFVFDPADRDSIIIDADFVAFIGHPLDGVVIDNCPPVVEEFVDMTYLDQCGLGYIVRLFTFTDGEGNQATWSQTIFFEDPNPFTEDQIIWPDHIDTSNVCGVDSFRPELLPDSLAFPRFIDEDECSLVGYDYKDEVIDASRGNEACFKIIRSWTVIDWCQTERGVHKKWFYDQVIEVRNTIAPTILNDCQDTVRCVINTTCEPDTFQLIGLANDDCTDSTDLFWRIKIDEFNDGTIDRVILSNDATGLYPFGVHKAKYIVEDLCGNQDSCEFLFELRNCKPPTAYCVNGLIAELTPLDTTGDGMEDIEIDTIRASDFDDGSSHVCGHGLVFSFSADTTDTVRTYDCDSLLPPRRDVTIWVTDRVTGEVSKCVNFVQVQDNNMVNVCDTTTFNGGRVQGLLSTNTNQMIDEAAVYLDQANQRMDMTNRQGSYTFQNVGYGSDFVIMPTKEDAYNNGVSTADLVAIQRHLLGKKTFDNPYLYIAADVNNTGSVSSADIAELRKVILGIRDDFPRNESWRFVDKSYQFPNPHDPWVEVFPEDYEVTAFSQDMSVDFVGVKIGDVTGDVELGGFSAGNQTRTTVPMVVRDIDFEQGEEILVHLTLPELELIQGCQFTLEWNSDWLEWTDIQPNTAIEVSKGNFGMHRVGEGLMSVSWHTTSNWNLPSNKQKFLAAVRFTAKRTGSISQAGLRLGDMITKNEVYLKGDGGAYALGLDLGTSTNRQDFTLYQNVPNPWSQTTKISFYLPVEGRADLRIFDESGRPVHTIGEVYTAGLHEVELSVEAFRAGVYYYRLETQSKTATKKMLIIK